MKRADRSGAIASLVIGEREAASQTIQLKWMLSQAQESFSQSDLLTQITPLAEQISRHKNP
jgi:histidyl-tRNA synthetase